MEPGFNPMPVRVRFLVSLIQGFLRMLHFRAYTVLRFDPSIIDAMELAI